MSYQHSLKTATFTISVLLLLAACKAPELHYSGRSVATITKSGTYTLPYTITDALLSSYTSNRKEEFSDYTFEVNDRLLHGRTQLIFYPEEKFVAYYDPQAPGSVNNGLIYYEPLFLATEARDSVTGKITKVYGKDRINGGGIVIRFAYTVPVSKWLVTADMYNDYYIHINGVTADSAILTIDRQQFLPPDTPLDSLKDTSKVYTVLYSPTNPRRAILQYR